MFVKIHLKLHKVKLFFVQFIKQFYVFLDDLLKGFYHPLVVLLHLYNDMYSILVSFVIFGINQDVLEVLFDLLL